jgi:ribulose-phosphate 3-epimerase
VKVARNIRSLGSKAAIAVKPATSADFLIDNLHEFDMVLIMTVEPGFGGQKFMAEMLPKIELVAKQIQLSGGQIRLQVDGGIDPETILQAAKSGADTFVAGSSVFQATDRNQKIQDLRRLALSVS